MDAPGNAPRKEIPPFSSEAQNVKVGLYRHYKGNTYRVLGVARHSETMEEMVVYEAQYGDKPIFVRPLSLFTDHVEANGVREPHFLFLGNET